MRPVPESFRSVLGSCAGTFSSSYASKPRQSAPLCQGNCFLLLCICAAGVASVLLESAFLPGSTTWSTFCLGCALCYFFAVLLLNRRFPVAGSETGDFLPGDFGAALLLLLAFLCGCWSFF